MPRAASEDSGSANGRCVTRGARPPLAAAAPAAALTSHRTTPARRAGPPGPCAQPRRPPRARSGSWHHRPRKPGAAPATRTASAPPPTLARAHAGLTPPVAANCVRCSRPRPRLAPPLRPTCATNGVCRRSGLSGLHLPGVCCRTASRQALCPEGAGWDRE